MSQRYIGNTNFDQILRDIDNDLTAVEGNQVTTETRTRDLEMTSADMKQWQLADHARTKAVEKKLDTVLNQLSFIAWRLRKTCNKCKDVEVVTERLVGIARDITLPPIDLKALEEEYGPEPDL